MIETALGIANEELNKIGVPYKFMRWTSSPSGRYWVGEYTETATHSEDGYEEGTLILTGTTKGTWLELMQDRETIKSHFSSISGFGKNTDAGTVAIFYEHSFPVPTGEADLKRMQVNLQIKAWKGIK